MNNKIYFKGDSAYVDNEVLLNLPEYSKLVNQIKIFTKEILELEKELSKIYNSMFEIRNSILIKEFKKERFWIGDKVQLVKQIIDFPSREIKEIVKLEGVVENIIFTIHGKIAITINGKEYYEYHSHNLSEKFIKV